MALKAYHQNIEDDKKSVFGVGDKVKVHLGVDERGKERIQIFEGLVLKIKGRGVNKSFTVRRIGAQQVGIERIFPIYSPIIKKVEVVKEGTRGVKRSKLYYTRDKSKKEIDKIFKRASNRELSKNLHKKDNARKKSKTKISKK